MKHETGEAAGGGVSSAATYDRIIILGSHPATVMLAPFDDPKALIYACSPHNVEQRTLPKCDEWFEVHDPVADKTRAYPYLKAVEQMPLVWMRDKEAMKFIPGAKAYPEAYLKSKFSKFKFTSSIAYIQAKAIHRCLGDQVWRLDMPRPKEVVDSLKEPSLPPPVKKTFEAAAEVYEEYGWRPPIPTIEIFGVMQASPNEYAYQRPGIQYFIREAEKLGILTRAPDFSKLFEPPPDNF